MENYNFMCKDCEEIKTLQELVTIKKIYICIDCYLIRYKNLKNE